MDKDRLEILARLVFQVTLVLPDHQDSGVLVDHQANKETLATPGRRDLQDLVDSAGLWVLRDQPAAADLLG